MGGEKRTGGKKTGRTFGGGKRRPGKKDRKRGQTEGEMLAPEGGK